MEKVAIARCAHYGEVESALRRATQGCLDWVRPGMKVAIKVNLVAAGKPESAVATHPAAAAAMARLLIERGAQVRVGDSPGGLFNAANLSRVYAATGMLAVEETGARLNRDFSQREADFPEARTLKRFLYTSWLDWADEVVNLCKLKTHGMMGMSCAVKNLFGVVPGTIKPEYHFSHSDPRDFAAMLLDLGDYVHARLNVCDAVVAMEGNGPTAGKPRQVGAILASASAHALDLACAHIIDLPPREVPTLALAQEEGRIPADVREMHIDGEWIRAPDFEKVAQRHSTQFDRPIPGPLGPLAGKILRRAMASVPQVVPAQCVGCQKCARLCPAKAISMRGRLPHIHRGRCIRCFCCQEFCPQGAMRVRRAAVARLLNP